MNETTIPIHAIKGRGAATRMAHRFESVVRDAFDDGWGTLQASTPDGPLPVVTEVTFEDAKSATSRASRVSIAARNSVMEPQASGVFREVSFCIAALL